jgi:hypothetical protein
MFTKIVHIKLERNKSILNFNMTFADYRIGLALFHPHIFFLLL